MPKKSSTLVDLRAIQQANEEHEQQVAAERKKQAEQEAAYRERSEAAYAFLDNIKEMSEHGAWCDLDGITFDPDRFSGRLVESFLRLCGLLRRQAFELRLEDIDVLAQAQFYGKEWPPDWAPKATEEAIGFLAAGISQKRPRDFLAQLEATVAAGKRGRLIWYMISPIVRGVVLNDLKVFWKETTPPAPEPTLPDLDGVPGRNSKRNVEFWKMKHERGMTPAPIRDEWNQSHQQQKVTREVVEKGILVVEAYLSQKVSPGKSGKR